MDVNRTPHLVSPLLEEGREEDWLNPIKMLIYLRVDVCKRVFIRRDNCLVLLNNNWKVYLLAKLVMNS